MLVGDIAKAVARLAWGGPTDPPVRHETVDVTPLSGFKVAVYSLVPSA